MSEQTRRTEDQWELVREGFVEGFINAYNEVTTRPIAGSDRKEIEQLAKDKAIEHVATLKKSGK